MTEEQIDTLMDETVGLPTDEWTPEHYLAWTIAFRRADQETKDVALAILRREIDVAASITVLQ
jgi:hypothetical protein